MHKLIIIVYMCVLGLVSVVDTLYYAFDFKKFEKNKLIITMQFPYNGIQLILVIWLGILALNKKVGFSDSVGCVRTVNALITGMGIMLEGAVVYANYIACKTTGKTFNMGILMASSYAAYAIVRMFLTQILVQMVVEKPNKMFITPQYYPYPSQIKYHCVPPESKQEIACSPNFNY